ncbi:MAG: alcohol dehydrogenase catalytic domain-containing protein, partial [Spirochaetia bacterium]
MILDLCQRVRSRPGRGTVDATIVSSTMKALQLVEIGAPLVERDLPVPRPGAGDVLVEVRAAGICRSDLHYREGSSPVGSLPLTPGHEVAGTVVDVGAGVEPGRRGEAVCLHYLCTCGRCNYCTRDNEQFCRHAEMIGKHRPGGYARYIVVPSVNALRIPDSVSYEHAAVMMCSSSTAVHALRKARIGAGETVAVIGAGGLGMSAVQLAYAAGAMKVYAVDIDPARLELAEAFGAVPVNVADAADDREATSRVVEANGGAGVDVAVELVGMPDTIRNAVGCLRPKGRAAVAGIGDEKTSFHVYRELMGKEAELIGVSDHLKSDLEYLLALAEAGRLTLEPIVTERVGLDAAAVN